MDVGMLMLSLAVLALTIVAADNLRRLRLAEENIEDTINTVQRLNAKMFTLREDLEATANSVRMHGAQLKGAGERIRKAEAEQAAQEKNLGQLRDDLRASDAAVDYLGEEQTTLEEQVKSLTARANGAHSRFLHLETLARKAEKLPDEIVELRQQVEGINTHLGRKIIKMETDAQERVRMIAEVSARRMVVAELMSRRGRLMRAARNGLRNGLRRIFRRAA